MKTAKDLAYKAYCDALKKIGTIDEAIIRPAFESWWSEWYSRESFLEHKDRFYHVHNVYVDGKRYIQAE